MITVKQIGQAYVKATQFLHPEVVEVDKTGIRYDRDFALVETNDCFVPSDKHGNFFPLKFFFDARTQTMRLVLPNGDEISGTAEANGAKWDIDHAGLRHISVGEVLGPWAEALSDFAGRPIRLVRCLATGAAVDVLPLTFITTGSLRRLEQELGEAVDPARFRAGFVLDNTVEHEEDGWDGQRMRLGTALLKVRTGVPRCAIPGFNPVTGVRDQDIMRSLIRYRDKVGLPDGLLPDYATPGFAAFAEVLEPGTVKVGDKAEVLS